MKRTMNEKRVLKKLKINDFRHMTKDQVVQFVSMLPQMDPEVAKKALEQFPEFRALAFEMTVGLKEIILKMQERDAAGAAGIKAQCDMVISALTKRLEKENLSLFEEALISEQIMKILTLHSEFLIAMRDRDLMELRGYAKTGILILLLAAGLLGGNAILSSENA